MEKDKSQDSISWGELAELNHAEQVARFGWCGCEDEGTLVYSDCPTKTEKQLEKAREFWAKVARENGWYTEPFFVQIWVNEEGEVTDSVSSRILTQDWVIEEKREECDECGQNHYDGEDCGFELPFEIQKEAGNGETITRNEEGRFVDPEGKFGYSTRFGGSWVCYTCGVLCECGEIEE